MPDERIEIMRRVALFDGLSDRELEAVANASKERRFDTGDTVVGEEGESSIVDLIEDRSSALPDVEAGRADLRQATTQVLSKALNERERLVVELRFGLVDGERYQLERIAEQLRLTRERVRQIESRALEKLRASRDAQQLLVYNAA